MLIFSSTNKFDFTVSTSKLTQQDYWRIKCSQQLPAYSPFLCLKVVWVHLPWKVVLQSSSLLCLVNIAQQKHVSETLIPKTHHLYVTAGPICQPVFRFSLPLLWIWKYKRTLETDETRYEMNLLTFAIAFIRPDWCIELI